MKKFVSVLLLVSLLAGMSYAVNETFWITLSTRPSQHIISPTVCTINQIYAWNESTFTVCLLLSEGAYDQTAAAGRNNTPVAPLILDASDSGYFELPSLPLATTVYAISISTAVIPGNSDSIINAGAVNWTVNTKAANKIGACASWNHIR